MEVILRFQPLHLLVVVVEYIEQILVLLVVLGVVLELLLLLVVLELQVKDSQEERPHSMAQQEFLAVVVVRVRLEILMVRAKAVTVLHHLLLVHL
jgi:hypothetical protein